jgi:GDP-L-fucose synthase
MNKNSKIYVAGHTGMVGSAIMRRLVNAGYTNLLTRDLHELDLTNQQAVNDFFSKEKPEYVIVAAAKVGGIVANNTYRGQFIYENLMIESNIIHASHTNKVEKLIFLGSSCIYPKLAPQPIKEEYLLTGLLEQTNEPYAIAKITGIKLCEAYHAQYGSNFFSVMPTNLYGPNDNYNLETSHVLPALIRKMHLAQAVFSGNWDLLRKDLNKRPIEGINGNNSEAEILEKLSKFGVKVNEGKVQVEIWGTGTPFREFLFVEDLADAIAFLLENQNVKDILKLNNEQPFSFVNIGTGIDLTIKDLVYLVKKSIGYQGEIYFDSTKPDGTPRKLLNVDRLEQLGWKFKVPLDEGVKMTYNYYCNNL